jgi:hypothetical protein
MIRWSGTATESQELLGAIARNCACDFCPMGVRLSTCAPHQALVDDQRWLDGLLFMRSRRAQLLQEEMLQPE